MNARTGGETPRALLAFLWVALVIEACGVAFIGLVFGQLSTDPCPPDSCTAVESMAWVHPVVQLLVMGAAFFLTRHLVRKRQVFLLTLVMAVSPTMAMVWNVLLVMARDNAL